MAQLSSDSLQEAAEIASWINSSNVFWSVLALLLGAGCIYYLFNWLYLRQVRAHQEKLQALYTLAEGLIPTDQPSAILKQIADVIPLIADATHCSIWIFNPASQKLDYGAGTDKTTAGSLSLSAIAGAVTCYRNQAVTDVPDAEDCPFVNKETVRRLGQKALLYVPIMADRSCLGVIEVEDRRRKRIFPREQKVRVEHVAKLAALALWQRAEKSLKDQLYRTEKTAAMSEFIEGVGEELVGPLGAILNAAQRCEQNGQQDMAGQVALISREARRASEALERLIKFARPRQVKLEKVNVNRLLESVAESIRREWKPKGLKLRLELSRAAPEVTADSAHLKEILVNVFRNAERFLESLGRQSVEVFTDLLDRSVLITITPEAGPPVSASSDSINSMAEKTDGSSGLGLSVCRSLIESAGGALRVDQAATRGFCIEIEYPLSREIWPAAAAAPVESRESRPIFTPAMALVIEDDRSAQDALLDHLTDRGHRVVVASSVEEGFDLAERGQFDWVFCKIQIGRISGLEIYRRLQGRVEKFVFLTDEKAIIFNDELFAGEDRFALQKPIKEPELERLIDLLQGQSAGVDEEKKAEV